MNAASTSAPERCFHSPSASTTGATGDEPWTIDGRCVSSKSSECDCAPFAIAAKSALVRWPRATTVACGSPPVAAITLPIAIASGSTEPRIAVPNQSVTERCAAVDDVGRQRGELEAEHEFDECVHHRRVHRVSLLRDPR